MHHDERTYVLTLILTYVCVSNGRSDLLFVDRFERFPCGAFGCDGERAEVRVVVLVALIFSACPTMERPCCAHGFIVERLAVVVGDELAHGYATLHQLFIDNTRELNAIEFEARQDGLPKTSGGIAYRGNFCRFLCGQIQDQTFLPRCRRERRDAGRFPLSRFQKLEDVFGHGFSKLERLESDGVMNRFGDLDVQLSFALSHTLETARRLRLRG